MVIYDVITVIFAANYTVSQKKPRDYVFGDQ